MTKEPKKVENELPRTMSADQATGVANSNGDRRQSRSSKDVENEGIRPAELNSENDQGAS